MPYSYGTGQGPTPSPTPNPAPASPAPTGSMPLNPDGTPNFSAGAPPASGGTSSTGTVNIWNLPTVILDYEKSTPKPFFWDTQSTSNDTSGNKAFNNPAFRRANDLPDSSSSPTDNNVMVSAEDLMKQFSAMAFSDPGDYLQFQTLLSQGPWSSGMKVTGAWDQTTEGALVNAMEKYLQTSQGAGVPVTFRDFLQKAAESNQALNPGGGSGGSLPSRPALTDPDTLAMYAQRAAQAALGRALTPDEVNKFVSQFHDQQTNAFNDALHGKGDVVDKNDPRASAIHYVTQSNQPEFEQHQIQGYADAFFNMFLPSSSAAPQQNVDPQAVSY